MTAPETLRGLASKEYGVWIQCEFCMHSVTLDPAALIPHLGGDFPIPDLPSKMSCSRCGSRKVVVQIDTPRRPPITRHT